MSKTIGDLDNDDEIVMVKNSHGHFVPADEEQAEKLKRIKVGDGVRVKVVRIRNYKFLQKYMVLVKYLYDIWEDGMQRMTYRGEEVRPNKERFRKDLQILCGFYERTFNYKGEMRLESKSVSFASMSEEEFSRVYNRMIDIGLSKILNRPDLTPEMVRRHCDQLMGFDS